MNSSDFVDYYALLGVPPTAEEDTIQRVYQLMAGRCQPSPSQPGDPELFGLLQDAYRTLRASDTRSRYDVLHGNMQGQPIPFFQRPEFSAGIEQEPSRRLGVLALLYHARHGDFEKPGIPLLTLEALTLIPREHLQFTLTYLREHGLTTVDENSSFVITSRGMDFVESHIQSGSPVALLLKAAERGRLWTPGIAEAAQGAVQ